MANLSKDNKPICKSKLIFHRLLEKLTKNSVFSVNDKLVKQVEECHMHAAISVIMSGIHMKTMENDFVVPLNPKLYKCYVDDTITKRKKNATETKLQKRTQLDFLTQPSMLILMFP